MQSIVRVAGALQSIVWERPSGAEGYTAAQLLRQREQEKGGCIAGASGGIKY